MITADDIPAEWVDAVIYMELGRRERDRDAIDNPRMKGSKINPQTEFNGSAWARHMAAQRN